MASYIDAEEYLKRICEVEYQMDRQSNKPITAMIAKNVFMLVRDELRGMPIADVRENVHGEWRKVYPAYELNIIARKHEPCYVCSKCNAHVDVKTPFCPSCGADMRGGE